MQRYFVESSDKSHITFSKEQTHHMLKVMRMSVGTCCYVVLKNSEAGIVEISAIENDTVYVKWIEDDKEHRELPISVTIACGLPKGDKLELITQKATELGVHCIIPLVTDWSITKWDNKKAVKKVERLQKIALEAAEQSHRTTVPVVTALSDTQSIIKTFKQYTHVLVAYEETAKTGEKNQFKQVIQTMKQGESLLIIFGSEGGLSSKEIDLFLQNGAVCCGLGPRIMRAETAPLYALSAISYEMELK